MVYSVAWGKRYDDCSLGEINDDRRPGRALTVNHKVVIENLDIRSKSQSTKVSTRNAQETAKGRDIRAIDGLQDS